MWAMMLVTVGLHCKTLHSTVAQTLLIDATSTLEDWEIAYCGLNSFPRKSCPQWAFQLPSPAVGRGLDGLP